MAQNNLTTFITANADFSSLRTQLAAVTAQLVKLQETTVGTNAKLGNQVAVMNKAFSDTLRSTGQFSTHFVTLSSDVDKFGKNLDSGRLKLNQYYKVWQGHTRNTGMLVKDLAKQQVMLQQAIVQPLGKNAQGMMQYNVQVAKGLDLIKNKTLLARQEAAIMNRVMLDGSTQLINWGKNTQWAGRQLTVGLTVPLAAFGVAAQKAFKEADAELVRLQKVYGGLTATSAIELAKVRADVSATAKEIASSYGVAFKDTISLAADLAATGKEGNDLIQATQQTTRLAVLGEVDRQEAMKATLAIQNAFKQNTEELTASIDFLNSVENQTSTSLQDLTEAIPKAGPVVKALGGSVKDLALYMTAMKEGGIDASQGANAIKSAMASLINPTKVAKEMFMGFGIDLGGIVTSNAGDLTGTILALQSALDNLDPLSKSKAIEQLFGKFQFARMSALFDNLGKSGSQTLQVMDLMKASAADLADISSRELSMMTESASGQFKRALATIQADLARVGEQFLKISTVVLKTIDGIVKFFEKLPSPIKNVLGVLGGITAAAGPLIMLTGVLGNFVGYVIKGVFHLKSLIRGGQGFKLLTPEIVAANAAAKGLQETFYNDAEATNILATAVDTLTQSFNNLELKANAAKVAMGPAISTVAGNVISTGGGRTVDKDNPLVGKPYSRQMAHMIPAGQQQMGSIFGVVPNPGPVNQRIGKNPQSYMNQDLPRIPGVTSVNGISNGIVAQEAAKWHAMTASLAMQSESEIKLLKTEVLATGTVTTGLTQSYQALLPEFTTITTLAAEETRLIVAELQASKITVDQARAKVIALNSEIEAMLAQTATQVAATMGRTVNLTTVPLTGQPAITPTGKSNMKELFHKGPTANLVNKIAAALGGVRTSGAGYSIQTTKPTQLNAGGKVYNPARDGNIVPGSTSIKFDNTPAVLQEGGFILNQDASKNNPDLVSVAKNSHNAGGKVVPALLTPGETYFPPEVAQEMMPTLEKANGGSRIQFSNVGGIINPRQMNYGVVNPRIGFAQLARAFISNKSGLTASEKINVLLASAKLTGKKPATKWPAGVERAHMVEGRPVTVQSKDYTYHPGVMFMQGKKINQATKSSGAGATGLEVVKDFEAMTKKGLHPASLLSRNSNQLGYGAGDKAIMDAYEEIIATLSSKKYAQATLGGKNGIATLESITEPILKKHLSKILGGNKTSPSIESGRTLWNDLYHQGGVRGKTGKTEDVVDLMGYNLGGMIGGRVTSGRKNYGLNLPPSVINNLTAKWPPVRQFYKPGFQYKLGNQDPLHGPLQIGLSQNLKQYAGSASKDPYFRESVVYKDDRFNRINIMDAFLTGTMEKRGKYATAQYMEGNLDIMSQMERLGNHPLGPIAAMRSVQKKYTGKLYRGLKLDKTFRGLPQDLIDAIKVARATGDESSLIGKEFIMRRSSWSKSPTIASFFAPGSKLNPDALVIEAGVRNRNILPAGDMFPDKKFMAPHGQDWSGGKLGMQYRSEQEAILGGKFKVVGFENGRLKVETVVDAARENGGPVNAGRPYLVGEKGPELFVPKNSGGIIPGYALGGKVHQGKNNYGMLGTSAAMMAAMFGSQALGSKVGGGAGNAISMAGQFLPFMLMGALGGKPKGPQDGVEAKEPSWIRKPIFNKTTAGLKDLTLATTKSGLAMNTLKTTAFKLLGGITPLGIGITGVTAALYIANKAYRAHNEHLRIGQLQYALTADAAQKAGVKFVDYNQKLKDVVESSKQLVERNQLIYESMTNANTPISMTIEEYKKLKKEVKSSFGDQIKLINQSDAKDTAKLASDLKSQLVAAGMSAEDATKKIYAMFKLSNKQGLAASSTVGNSTFNAITDAESAAVNAVSTYGASAKQGGREGAGALNTGLQSIDTAIADAQKRNEKEGKTVSLYETQKQVLDKINAAKGSSAKLTADTLRIMEKENPELRKIATEQDTVISLWQKMALAARGFTGDMSKLGASAVDALTKIAIAVEEATIAANKSGILKSQYKDLGKLQAQYDALKKAAKGQSVQQQINTRDALAGLQKQIDKNNKLADARLRALDAAKQEGDLAREIAKKQAEYDAALATGNTAAAQQASLDIQGLQSDQQYVAQKKAIEDALKLKNAPLEKQIELINAGQQKMSDQAALAGDSLEKLASKIDTQKQKIDDVNVAMTAFRINAAAANKSLEEYAQTQKGRNQLAAIENANVNAGNKSGTTPSSTQVSYTPGSGVSVVATGGKTASQSGLDLLKLTNDAIKKGLTAKEMSVTNSGDIYINNKKVDVSSSADAKKINQVPNKYPQGSGPLSGGTYIGSGALNQAGIRPQKGTIFKDKSGQKWEITGEGYYDQFPVAKVKAGYGMMNVNPKVPTIVGDRGPEMLFNNMVIPNMAKVPYASPKYDVNQAALRFEPMQDRASSSSTVNLTQNIYPSEGMNTDAFVRQVVTMTKQAIGQDAKINAKMVGNPMNVSIKRT